MSDQVWYYHTDGAQQGPVALEQLRTLAAGGGLGQDDLVWKAGMPEWVAARTVPELADATPAAAAAPTAVAPEGAAPAAAGPAPAAAESAPAGPGLLQRVATQATSLPHLRLVGALVDILQGLVSEQLLDSVDRFCKRLGNFAYVVAALLFLVVFIVIGIKANNLRLLFGAILLIVPGATIAHYAAARFLDAGNRLIHRAPSKLASEAFLTCFGLYAVIGGFFWLVTGIYAAAQRDDIAALAQGIGGCLVLIYVGGVALSPSSVNVSIGKGLGAGEEAIGIMMFLMKLPLRLVPFIFGVGSMLGALAALFVLIQLFTNNADQGALMATPFAMGVLSLAMVPFLAYVFFLLAYLSVDVLRAILVVPARLDALRAQRDGEDG